MKKTVSSALLGATLFLLAALSPVCTFAAPNPPASCTAAIGSPANGAAHHLSITWATVGGATSYILQYSTDSVNWNPLYTGTATIYDHSASASGNMPFYYRVSCVAGTQSTWQECTQFPIYTACDNPALPQLSAASYNSLSIQLVPESPTPNPAYTTYSIYCTTTSQFVQANGTLGATEVFQTRAAWGTLAVTGLTASTNYCFYAKAKNKDGDTRLATIGSSISAVQTFDATGSLNTSQAGTQAAYWTPPTPSSGNPLIWQSTGGCSGGTGGGNVAFSGSFTNYFGSFLRTPAVSCTGNTAVVLSFDLSNSYVASHIVSSPSSCDAARFYIYNNSSSYITVPTTVKIGGVDHSSVDGNGTWLKFDAARSCVHVDVTFDLSGQANISSLLFYIEPDNPYNDSYTYSVNIDNVSLNQGAPSACLSTTACTAATISANPVNQSPCANSNASFSVTTAGSVSNYQWQVSTNGTTWNNLSNGSIYSNVNTATLNITGATNTINGYQYRCQVTGACAGTPVSGAATLTIAAAPGAAGTISGTSAVCQNQNNVSFSVASVNIATGYNWSLPTGASIAAGANTNNISVNFGTNSGTVIVTPFNNCGPGTASQAFNVTVNLVPATPVVINGSDSVCLGSPSIFSVDTVSGASSYTWTLPNNWTGASGTNSITATAGTLAGGSISVTANNTCGPSSLQTKSLTVNQLPQVTYNYTGGTVCTNQTPFALTGGTPAGGIYTGTGVNGGTFDPATGVGTYTITYFYTDAHGCANNDTSAIHVSICTGLGNIRAETINVYPNPFSDYFTVSGHQQASAAILSDATGRILGIYEIQPGVNVNIQASGLAKGVYLLNVISAEGNNLTTKKVIKVD